MTDDIDVYVVPESITVLRNAAYQAGADLFLIRVHVHKDEPLLLGDEINVLDRDHMIATGPIMQKERSPVPDHIAIIMNPRTIEPA